MPKNTNNLGGRFVLAIKDEGTKEEVWKACFVVQGYKDKIKRLLYTILPHQGNTPHDF